MIRSVFTEIMGGGSILRARDTFRLLFGIKVAGKDLDFFIFWVIIRLLRVLQGRRCIFFAFLKDFV